MHTTKYPAYSIKMSPIKNSTSPSSKANHGASNTTSSSTAFYLNPPTANKIATVTKTSKDHNNNDNFHRTTNTIQSSGSSINLNQHNQMMSSSLSSSSGLVEGSSRSSSSIDTGSNTNTDELLNAGTDIIANNSDLSGTSSRRSSINDIGMDIEENGYYKIDAIAKGNPEPMADVIDDSTTTTSAVEPIPAKTKTPKKQRQSNYFCRSRRGRIVKTPPLEWKKSQSLLDNDEDKVSDQLDSPKSPRNQELYEYYLKNRNAAVEKDDDDEYDDDEEMFMKVNTTNYSNIESLKLKFDSPQKSKFESYFEGRNKPLVSNWLSSSTSSTSSATRFTQNGSHGGYTKSSSIDMDERGSPRKSLDTSDSDANDSSSYQAKKQAFYKQQQQDKPVFKYLSKNLMNNLFVKNDANSSTDSLQPKTPTKTHKFENHSNNNQHNSDNLNKSTTSLDKPLTVSTATTSQEKPYPSSINYNYLVNKYSPNGSTRSDPIQQSYKSKQEATHKVNSSIVSIIKDLVTDAIDTTTTIPETAQQQPQPHITRRRPNKSMSDELEVAVTVELESDEDVLNDASLSSYPKLNINTTEQELDDYYVDRTYLNTERNRGHLSPRDRIITMKEPVQSPPKPLIKTLINDITKLKSDAYLSNCLDYLNQNFNKTLDDLIELEDNKKLACNTRLNAESCKINTMLKTKSNKPVTKIIAKSDNKNFNNATTSEQVKFNKRNQGLNNICTSNNKRDDRKAKSSNHINNSNDELLLNGSNLSDQIKVSILGGGKANNRSAMLDSKKLTTYLTNQQGDEQKHNETEQFVQKQQPEQSKRKSETHNNISSMQLQQEEANNGNTSTTSKKVLDEERAEFTCNNECSNLVVKKSCANNNDPIDLNYLNNYAKLYVGNSNGGSNECEREEVERNSAVVRVEVEEEEENITTTRTTTTAERQKEKKREYNKNQTFFDDESKTENAYKSDCYMKTKNKSSSETITDFVSANTHHNLAEEAAFATDYISPTTTATGSISLDNECTALSTPVLLLNSIRANNRSKAESNTTTGCISEEVIDYSNKSVEIEEAAEKIKESTEVISCAEEMGGDDAPMNGSQESAVGETYEKQRPLPRSESIVSDVIESEKSQGSDSKKLQQADSDEIDKSVISETIDSLIQQVDDSLSSDNNSNMKAQEHEDTEAESELEEEVVQLIENMTAKVDRIQEVHRAESELTNTSLLMVETSKQDEEEEEEEEEEKCEVYVQNDQVKDNPQVDDDEEQVVVIQKDLETENDALNLSTNTTSECTKTREDEKQENSTTTTSSSGNSSSSIICSKSTIDEEKDVEKIDNTNTTNSFTTTTTGPTNKINSTIAEETEEAESTQKVVGGETNNNKDEELVVFVASDDDNDEGEEEEHEETEELTIEQENLEKTETFCGDNSHKNNHTNSKSELQENTLTPSATTISVSHHNNTATDIQRDTAISSSTPSTTIINEELDNIIKGNDLAAGLLLSDDSGDLSINRLSAIEKIDKTSENSISTTLSLNDSISSDTHSSEIHQDQDDSLMNSSDLDATNASSNGAVKKIVLKNKEIVLVESCSDDDEKDLKQIIRRKNESPHSEELFPVLVAQERKAARQRAKQLKQDQLNSPKTPSPSTGGLNSQFDMPDLLPKSTAAFVPSSTSTSSYLNSSRKTDTSDEDDPFVKAALERFDAFCKSKSTQSLDKAGLVTPSSSQSPSQAPQASMTQRQKSPFLTRRTINQPGDDPKLKESIGSFIKRRQARIDPNLLNKHTSSTPNGSDSESKFPAAKPPIFNRSVSETRSEQSTDNLFATTPRNNKEQSLDNSLSSSNLAKRFLGSLTPQLEPLSSQEVAAAAENRSPSPKKSSSPITKEKSPIIPDAHKKETPPPPPQPPARRRAILQNKQIPPTKPATTTTKTAKTTEPSKQATSNFNINRTSSAPSTLPLNLRQRLSTYDTTKDNNNSSTSSEDNRRGSTSSNSSCDEIKPTRSKQANTNVIKLEVVNSKSKTPSPEKEKQAAAANKPPLPPVPAPSVPINNNWHQQRSAVEPQTAKKQLETGSTTTTTTTVTAKPPSPKPGVRMIPLEVKNTKSRVIPIEVKSNGASVSRSNSKTENKSQMLNSSFKQASIPASAAEVKQQVEVVEKKTQSAAATPEKELTSMLDTSRPRSVSSFRAERDQTLTSAQQQNTASNLRNSSSFSYRDLTPSVSSNLSTSYAYDDMENSFSDIFQKISNLNKETTTTEDPQQPTGDGADPIVEKACSNFMYKLMEFQRQHTPYSSQTLSYSRPAYEATSTVAPVVTAASPLNSEMSPSTSSSNLYTRPIVSARSATFGEYSSRLGEQTGDSTITTTVNSYSAPYTSSYANNFSYSNTTPTATSLHSRPSYASNSNFSTAVENPYKTDLNKFSDSENPARPYVSAIRKRRTLFEDLQASGPTTPAINHNTQNYMPTSYSTDASFSTYNPTASNDVESRLQRPLSIVNEEAAAAAMGYHPLTRSLSAKGDSRVYQSADIERKAPSADISYKLSRPPLNKSASTTSATTTSATSVTQKSYDSTSTSGRTSPMPSKESTAQPKLRSTVFDRLTVLNNTNTPKLSGGQASKSNSNLNLNLETPNKSKRDIKDQNEIAVVTNMTPKKELSQSSSLNRIRSLDSKSRDKLKNKDFLKKSTSSLSGGASSKPANSSKNSSETSKSRLKSASSQLPPAGPSANSGSTSPTNFNSNSNPSFKVDEGRTAASTSSSNIGQQSSRVDVFERLSKRTNSMKNLSNGNLSTSNQSHRKSHRSIYSPASSDHDTDSKCSPTTSHVEDHDSHSHNSVSSHSTNNHNSLSKTSVFERLYKSNIAAHQSYKNQEDSAHGSGSTLKKSMSNSTASLASSTGAGTGSSSLSRRTNWTARTRGNLSASAKAKFAKQNDNEDNSKNDDDQSSSSN